MESRLKTGFEEYWLQKSCHTDSKEQCGVGLVSLVRVTPDEVCASTTLCAGKCCSLSKKLSQSVAQLLFET